MTWRILLANLTLAGQTGTEVVTRDLARGLNARGHHVSVFARALGPLADELRAAGIPVVARLEDLRDPPDLVHGHHFIETVEALARFPSARGVFVCHDRISSHSIPPRLARVRRYVAVDENCLERLREDWHIPAALTRVILNAVDTARFLPRDPLPPGPARALVFSHYASAGTHLDVVREACARLGIAVDVLGAGAGTAVATPETRLGQYDVVFAKGRSAIEAMAVGAAVVLCDVGGLGPMVTRAELHRLRQWNFGQRVLREALDPDRLVREIRRYDPAEAAAVSQVIREEASLTRALDQYEALYAEVMADPPAPAADAGAGELLGPLIKRIGNLEAELASYRRPERMPALSDEDVSALRVSMEDAPATLAAGATTFVRVRLWNDLATDALGTWPPFPLQWAYRWRRDESASFDEVDHERTPLRRPVRPLGSDVFAIRVTAPAIPGRYVLHVTLVQEGLRWLDHTATPVFADMAITISER